MTNRVAIVVVLLMAACYGTALFFVDSPGLFLARKFLDLIAWLAFWR